MDVEDRTAPLLAAARALVPELRAAADRAEQARRLPPEVVRALAQAGVFRMCVPRAYGGGEIDPAGLVAVLETLAAADGAGGWCAMIAATTGVLAAYLPEAVAREIYGAPDVVTGGVYAPVGTAQVVDGGYRVSGRWPFASGCEHCAWLLGGAVLPDAGDGPRARLMIFPANAARIIDTWTVAGLRGTGSHDIAVEDLFVPTTHTVSLVTDRPRAPGMLYAFPVFGLLALGIASVALGIARSAIDALAALARGKTPTGSRRLLADRPLVQAQIAEAEARVRGGRALVLDAVGEACAQAGRAEPIGLRERAVLRLATTHATRVSAEAVDLMYHAGGGTAVYATSPLQRAFRDVHVVTQHMMVAPTTLEVAGRVLLGLEVDASTL